MSQISVFGIKIFVHVFCKKNNNQYSHDIGNYIYFYFKVKGYHRKDR